MWAYIFDDPLEAGDFITLLNNWAKKKNSPVRWKPETINNGKQWVVACYVIYYEAGVQQHRFQRYL